MSRYFYAALINTPGRTSKFVRFESKAEREEFVLNYGAPQWDESLKAYHVATGKKAVAVPAGDADLKKAQAHEMHAWEAPESCLVRVLDDSRVEIDHEEIWAA